VLYVIVFISHGHTDHVASLFAHARARSLSNDAATYYIPPCALAPLQAAKRAFEQLDSGHGDGHDDHDENIPMNFVVVKDGDEYVLDSNHSVRVFATDHRVPSIGYAIIRREKGGLAPEYVGLPRDQLIALRDKGVEIQPTTTTVDLVYTGDTRIGGLDKQPLVWQAKILITELSFLDDTVSIEASEEKGHIHLYSFVERAKAGKLDAVEAILFIHMSARYTHGETISSLVATQWPVHLRSKVHMALEAFFITDSRTEWYVMGVI
jgi:ribonuclease Z